MNRLEEALAAEMAGRTAAGLRRSLPGRASGARELEFSSNDYLGLATHPSVVAAARAALSEHGAGGRAARLLGGGSPLDAAVEEAVADWLGAESALLFPSGYQANLGVVTALAGPADLVVSDELNHASLIDAARLSRARVHVVRHGDLDELGAALARGRDARRRLVLTEGVFSMDGDRAPLKEIAERCARHDAWLVVDEAHAAGLLGPERAGAWAWALAEGADPAPLAARIVTGGKALGVAGALAVGARGLREELINRARSFVYTTAVSPAVSGALLAAVGLVRGDGARAARALGIARGLARRLGLAEPAAAIVPVVVGTSERALAAADTLQARGLDVRAVRPPTVPEGTARLRIACHAFNTEEAVGRLAEALDRQGIPARRHPRPPPAAVTGRGAAEVLAVVGTDTGVGKTVVGALLVRAARAAGLDVRYWKPVQTGTSSDTRTVAELAAIDPARLPPPLYGFGLPASPHEAAAAQNAHVELERLRARLRDLRQDPGLVVLELAGGLLVPYDERTTQADLLALERLPTVLVARSGLGTLNHTLLTLEALEARHLRPRALILVGPPHPSNRATLERRSGIERVYELPPLEPLDGAALDRWIAANDLAPLFGR